MKRVALWACMVLAGCHASYGYQWRMPGATHAQAAVDMRVAVPTNSVAGAILIGVLLADGVRYFLHFPDGTRIPYYGVPDADAARRINVQDCTRPIDIQAGNLMCR